MSRSLRQRAQKNRERGAAARRDWTPSPDSASLAIYRWYMAKTGTTVVRENFCHFWRVVLIWAPLRWLLKPLAWLLLAACLAGITWLAVTFTGKTLGIALAMIALLYLICGVKATPQLAYELEINEEGRWPWLADRPLAVRGFVYLLTSPIIVAIAALVIVLGSAIAILAGLHNDYDLYGRCWRWMTQVQISRSKWLSWIRPWQAIPATLLVLSWWYFWAMISIVIMLLIACACLIVDVLARLEMKAEAERQETKARQREAEREALRNKWRPMVDQVLRIIFEVYHPDWARSDARWQDWKERYARWFCWMARADSIYDSPAFDHMGRIRRTAAYLQVRQRFEALQEKVEQAECEALPPSSPVVRRASWWSKWGRKIKKPFVVVGDLLSLAWSAILAWKWGFCPWVKLPPEDVE